MLDEKIASALTNLGHTMSLVVQSFEERTFLSGLRPGDIRVKNIRKAMTEVLGLIGLVDDFHGSNKARYYSCLWQHSYILCAQISSYVHKNPNDMSMSDIQMSEELGRISSFISRKPQQPVVQAQPVPAAAQQQQAPIGQAQHPGPAAAGGIAAAQPPQLAAPRSHVAIDVNAVANQQVSLFGNLWLKLTNFFIFSESNDYAQYNFLRKGLWWIMKAIQYPLTAVTDFTEASLRTIVGNLFYYLRHPNYIGNNAAHFEHDENINLNTVQYGIKEIAVGLDKTIQNLFGIKNLVIHPADSLAGLYQTVKAFYQSEKKWEQVKDAVNEKFQHVYEHPFQYLPDLIIFLATMIPTVYAGVRAASGAGTAASISAPLAKESLSAPARYVPQYFVPEAFAGAAVARHAFAPSILPAFNPTQLLLEVAGNAALVAGAEVVPPFFKSPFTSSLPGKDFPTKKLEKQTIGSVISAIPLPIDELKNNLVFLKDCLGTYTDDNDKIMRAKIVEEIDLTREAILKIDPTSAVISDEIKAVEATEVYLKNSLEQYTLPSDGILIAQINSELKIQQVELQKLKFLMQKYKTLPVNSNGNKVTLLRVSSNEHDTFFNKFDSVAEIKKPAKAEMPDQGLAEQRLADFARTPTLMPTP